MMALATTCITSESAQAQSQTTDQVSFEVERFIIEGNNPISDSAASRIVAPFTGRHVGIERLREAATTLEQNLKNRGYDFHRVTLPPQVLDAGAVTLEVRSLSIGEITISGNQHFSDANIRRSLPQLRQGTTPNTRALSRALAVSNFNTAKRTRLTFGRGGGQDDLDARIDVRDRNPRQGYSWLNNTGTEQTTRTRLGLGYQHRNLFDLDHNLTATYTTSPEQPDRVQQYGVNYQLPLYPVTGTLGLFYADSDVDSGRVADFFDVSGSGQVTGIRYSQVLNKLGIYRQRAYIDVFDKLFDNSVDFAGNDIGVDVRSRPLTVAWQIEWDKTGASGRINLGYAINLDGGSLNTQADYRASRVGASRDWQAFRLNATQDINLPHNWRLSLGALAQYSDEPLIAGEQLGLGGAFGPRGFEEREVGVDRGMNLKVQLWAPPFDNDIEVGPFLDYGFGDRLNPQPGEVDTRSLSSVGIAARWQWRGRFVVSVDVGHVLEGLEEPDLTQDGDNRVHFNLIYRFAGE